MFRISHLMYRFLHNEKLGFEAGTELISDEFPEIPYVEDTLSSEQIEQWNRNVNTKMRLVWHSVA